MSNLTRANLTGIYLRISNLTFGGGDPTMAGLYTELVVRRRWLAEEKYGLVFALSRLTPGTNIIAFIAGTAWELGGWGSSAAAVAAATLPCSVLTVLLSAGYDALRTNPRAMAAIGGLLAAAAGMMVANAWQLLAPHLSRLRWQRSLRAILLAGAALVLSWRFQMTPVAVLALAALAGFLDPEPEAQ